MNIKPGVVIDGQTYYPPGWMYVLAFALKGVPWAIKECEKEGFKETIKQHLRNEKNKEITESIEYHLQEIEKLKNDLG
jgi:hypothetical protein